MGLGVPWTVLLHDELAARANQDASRIVERFRSLGQRILDPHVDGRSPSIYGLDSWYPHSLAGGNAGLAVTSSYLDQCFPGEAWDVIGHKHLEVAIRTAERDRGLPPGLFSGVCGLAYSAWCLSQGSSRYRMLLRSLDSQVVRSAELLVSRAKDQKKGLPVEIYDLVSGLSGIGAYLLKARKDAEVSQALDAVLELLVVLSESDNSPTHFYTMPDRLDPNTRRDYPSGYLNCGLAHGIAGPLALLSLAKLSKVEVDGMDEAADSLATLLSRNCRSDDEWGTNWPAAVPLKIEVSSSNESSVSLDTSHLHPCRTAWCYGAPGVSRALWLFGVAFSRLNYRELALSAMESVFRKSQEARMIENPILCHGVAGLLQITLRFGNETKLSSFTRQANLLSSQLLDMFEPGSLWGYKRRENDGPVFDDPGLLEGAAGSLMALLSGSQKVEPVWDSCFLLS